MIPWALYNLSPRDQAGQYLRPYMKSVSRINAIGVQFDSQTFTVPKEQVLLVSAASVSMESSGADTTISASFQVNDESVAGTLHFFASEKRGGAQNPTKFGFTWRGSPLLLAMDFQHITLGSVMASAVSSTSVVYSLAGVLIPRGTLSLI